MAVHVGYFGPPVGYFDSSPEYFDGEGSSSLVPWAFPVAIAGHPYMLDHLSGDFLRAAEPRLRDTVDQAEVPGENTINQSGLWRRGQTSWHRGAGQQNNDDADAELDRFDTSRRVDPWHKNDLRLLRTVIRIAESATNLFMVSVGTAAYYSASTAVKKVVAPDTVTTPFTAPAAVTGLATDGVRVFVASGDSQTVTMVNDATATNTTIVTGASGVNVIGYGRDRLVGAKSSTGALYDMTANIGTPAALPAAWYTHPAGAQFTWVGFTEGTNFIYAAGYIRSRSTIYKITLNAAGTALDTPTIAAQLPDGEVVQSVYGYAGLVFIGTQRGVRVAEADDAGNLIVGALIPAGGAVTCFEGEGQFIWYGNPSIDSTVSGLGRLDPTQILESSAPAYANDIEAYSVSGTSYVGDVQGVASITDATRVADPSGAFSRRYFSISGQGVFYESNLCHRSGYIETGIYTYSLPDQKLALKLDVVTAQAAAAGQTVAVSLDVDSAGYTALGSHDMGSVSSVIDTGQRRGVGFAVKLTLDAGADGLDIDDSPVLERWQLRAYPTPKRGRLLQWPVLLYRSVTCLDSVERLVDVIAEIEFLDELWRNQRVVLAQEGPITHEVIVENVEWHPAMFQGGKAHEPYWDGTALVSLKTLAE